MEAVILTVTFLLAAGIGYIPVRMLAGYKEHRRRQNMEYLGYIKAKTYKN